MKNKFSGFTIIELIIAITIASMLAIVLFSSFYQTNRTSLDVNNMISFDLRASILQNQLEKDINGAFIPNIETIKEKVEEKKQQPEKKGETEKKETEQKKIKEEEKPQQLEKVFYSINKEKNLNELTLITCNPLQVYGQQVPRIARVIYKLKENDKNSFKLVRQESLDLNYKNAIKSLEFELADNIKSLSIEYFYSQDSKEEEKERKFKKVNQWGQKDQKINVKLPMFVNIKLELWDASLKKIQPFEFTYQIFAFNFQQKMDVAKTDVPKKDEKKEKTEKEKKEEKEKIDKEKKDKEQKEASQRKI